MVMKSTAWSIKTASDMPLAVVFGFGYPDTRPGIPRFGPLVARLPRDQPLGASCSSAMHAFLSCRFRLARGLGVYLSQVMILHGGYVSTVEPCVAGMEYAQFRSKSYRENEIMRPRPSYQYDQIGRAHV